MPWSGGKVTLGSVLIATNCQPFQKGGGSEQGAPHQVTSSALGWWGSHTWVCSYDNRLRPFQKGRGSV